MEVKEKSKEKLQMPPIVPLRTDLGQVLDVDRDLVGYSSSKFVFTDVTFGISDKVIYSVRLSIVLPII